MPLPFSITVLSSVYHYALVVCGEGGGELSKEVVLFRKQA